MSRAAFRFGMALMVDAALYVSAKKAGAQPDEEQVKRDCRGDALRYCPMVVARYRLDPSPDRRMTILYCMLANKERLQEKCSRHLY